MTKAQVFTSANVTASLSFISTSRKPSHIDAVTVVATRAQVDIVPRAPIEK